MTSPLKSQQKRLNLGFCFHVRDFQCSLDRWIRNGAQVGTRSCLSFGAGHCAGLGCGGATLAPSEPLTPLGVRFPCPRWPELLASCVLSSSTWFVTVLPGEDTRLPPGFRVKHPIPTVPPASAIQATMQPSPMQVCPITLPPSCRGLGHPGDWTLAYLATCELQPSPRALCPLPADSLGHWSQPPYTEAHAR